MFKTVQNVWIDVENLNLVYLKHEKPSVEKQSKPLSCNTFGNYSLGSNQTNTRPNLAFKAVSFVGLWSKFVVKFGNTLSNCSSNHCTRITYPTFRPCRNLFIKCPFFV